jgi:hypothetical protein
MAFLRTRLVAVRSSLTSRWNWAEAKTSLVWKYIGDHQKLFTRLFIFAAIVATPIVWMLYLRGQGYVWADWTGFGPYSGTLQEENRGKTLWDWMQILIIPLMLAVVAYFFSANQRKTELEIAKRDREGERDNAQKNREKDIELADDRLREEALQSYLDRMGKLILKHDLLGTTEALEAKSRKIACVQTVTTLRKVDVER